jgi:hypothetical protein
MWDGEGWMLPKLSRLLVVRSPLSVPDSGVN